MSIHPLTEALTKDVLDLCDERLVGWLFWVKRPFETVFQSISGRLPKRGRKRREKDRRE